MIRTYFLLCLLAGLSGFFLSGCATAADVGKVNVVQAATPAPAVTTAPAAAAPAPTVRADLVSDLAAAQAIACNQVNGVAVDPQGCACYPVLSSYIQKSIPAGGSIAGPISAFEEARVKINAIQSGVPIDLQMACGALVVDVQNKIVNIGAMLAALGIKL